jgi:GT2 family glycosyltransferase
MAFAAHGISRSSGPESVPPSKGRLRVDGKFFTRGGRRFRIQGVTYGPFEPDSKGEPFPAPDRIVKDFTQMRAAGINSIRTYHLPPEWLLHLADEHGIGVFIDVPWPKHLCFLDSKRAQDHARQSVRQTAERGRNHPCVLAYSLCNEVPTNIVRWHGARRIESFIAELRDVAKQADPAGLVTYANYPPTEYLDLSFLDFATFNVYLHDRETFRRYLCRLQNLVGDKPLLLGEIGMDSLRNGEAEQALFLAGHVRELTLMGLAGVFVFSWTDDWFTGGYQIDDWAFGITRVDRTPKPACHALREVFARSPASLLPATPRVSVVVCTYNGGGTLDQCLSSLEALNYPDYEVIVVDDGSTDDTLQILSRHRGVRAIHQSNNGLSHARNVGLRTATGTVVAYTDSDCFADADWLTHLVDQLERTGAAAVGGPNLSPEDGRLAACVGAAPGQPMHVLESDQVAEHIPGCNMAYRKQSLLAVAGFDPQYRKAGDDVDVCWRLQQQGQWITFAPSAFVWHHRRQTPRTYLRQQMGYGEAEALLRFKHPDKYNGRGDGKWRGVLYGPAAQGLRLAAPIIYRGVFGTGLFQCLYQPAPAHWAMWPSTLEWHLAAALLGLTSIFWSEAGVFALGMLALSMLVATLVAAQARLSHEHDGYLSRVLIAALAYAQPLARSWQRYRTRLVAYRPPRADPDHLEGCAGRLPISGLQELAYWGENGPERTELLGVAMAYLNERGWGKTVDSGWSDWDVEVYCHPWTVVQVSTAQEDHGSGKYLIRVRHRMRASGYMKVLGVLSVVAAVVAAGFLEWEEPAVAAVFLSICLAGAALCFGAWWRGTYRATQAVAVFDYLASSLGLIRCEEATQRQRAGPETTPLAEAFDAVIVSERT